MKVRDVMTSGVVSVQPETPLKEVARLLAEHGISGVPVVDDEQQVVGVVSEADFLLKEQDAATRPALVSWLFDRSDGHRAHEAKLHATTAGQAMSSPAITIGPNHPLREAAAVMTRHSINRLPVVGDGVLIGIVTRADLVETFLVPDKELKRRIGEEVVRDTMWMSPEELDIEVVEGVARLTGTVDRRSTAIILERLVSHVDGVVAVESKLGWELDDRAIESVGVLQHEPTAASVKAREYPR